jgi:hypothetical protein
MVIHAIDEVTQSHNEDNDFGIYTSPLGPMIHIPAVHEETMMWL